jgi:SAM-dependent methyltransferase
VIRWGRLACADERTAERASRLLSAWHALRLLAPTETNPQQALLDRAVAFVCSKSGRTESQVRDSVLVESPVREDWLSRGASLSEHAKVVDFYRTTFSYVLELTAANLQVETLNNYQTVLRILKYAGVRLLADYGAGIGTFARLAAAKGLDVHAFDLDSETFQFAQSQPSCGRHPIRYSVVESHPSPMQSPVDCIVCTEVLEHLPDPDALLDCFDQSLAPSGILVLSESFDDIDDFCMHFPEHKGRGGSVFSREMCQRGYRPLLDSPECHIRVFVKSTA